MPQLRTACAALLLSALLADPLRAQVPDAAAQAPAASDTLRITVSFQATPMPDVLLTFASFSGRSIVVGPDAGGPVTAEIRDQPWDVALRAILLAHGLTAVETESGIIRVGSQEALFAREEVEETVVRIFRLRWQPAAELQEVVRSMLSERGSVAAVASTNSLVVRDVPRVVRQVAAILGHS